MAATLALDLTTLLALLAVLALALAVLASRARRFGVACTECQWRGRAYTLTAAEHVARRHAAAHRHDCNVYVRGRVTDQRPRNRATR